jgi:hypothetical protein
VFSSFFCEFFVKAENRVLKIKISIKKRGEAFGEASPKQIILLLSHR